MIFRWFLAVVIIVVASVFITWSLPGFPAIAFAATLAAFIYANHHSPDRAALFGAFCGLLLDFFSPEIVGLNMIALAVTSALASALRRYFAYESIVWYFMAGVSAFILRSLLILAFHVVIDGVLVISSDIRGYLSAALWTGILASFYFLLTESTKYASN